MKRGLDESRKVSGRYPESLSDLTLSAQFKDDGEKGGRRLDPWDRPYRYHTDGDTYTLGRDGKPGGVGLDEDLNVSQVGPTFQRWGHGIPTLRQFAFDCGPIEVAQTAVLTGLMGFIACAVTQSTGQKGLTFSLLGLTLTLFMCLNIGVLISLMYIPSNH